MITYNGETYDWADHHGGYYLDMYQIGALVSQPKILDTENEKAINIGPPQRSQENVSAPTYWIITLCLVLIPGQAHDIILPDRYDTADEAKADAEVLLGQERERLARLFRM